MFHLKKNTTYIDYYKNRCLCAYINSSIGTLGNITANCRFLKIINFYYNNIVILFFPQLQILINELDNIIFLYIE